MLCGVRAAATSIPTQTQGAGLGALPGLQQPPSSGMSRPPLPAQQQGFSSRLPVLSCSQAVTSDEKTHSLQQGGGHDPEEVGEIDALVVQSFTHEQNWPGQARTPADPLMVCLSSATRNLCFAKDQDPHTRAVACLRYNDMCAVDVDLEEYLADPFAMDFAIMAMAKYSPLPPNEDYNSVANCETIRGMLVTAFKWYEGADDGSVFSTLFSTVEVS